MKAIEASNPEQAILEIETDTGITISFNSGFGSQDGIESFIDETTPNVVYFIGTNTHLEYASLLVVDLDHLEYLRSCSHPSYIETDVFLKREALEQYSREEDGYTETFFDLGTKEQIDILSNYIDN